MRFSPTRFFFALLVALLPCAVSAQAASGPVLAAKSWVLVDHATGQVLADNMPDSRVDAASLTKLMNAYLVFAALRVGALTESQMVQVSQKACSQKAQGQDDPIMFLDPGVSVSVGDLVRGLTVRSANDAGIALAELLAGSEENFVTMMNREAERLGMKNTHFANATGQPRLDHYTTARDMATLASAIVRDFPQYYSLFSIKSFTYNRIAQPSRNSLLWRDPTVDGLKTGHAPSSGYALVSSAQRGQQRLIAVVLGAASDSARTQESLKLINYGFLSYDTFRIYTAGQVLSQFRVWKGEKKQVNVGFARDFTLSLPKEKTNKIEATLESRQPVLAPLIRGQEIGTLKLTVDGELFGTYSVVALDHVPLAGFFGRLWDAIMLWFKNL